MLYTNEKYPFPHAIIDRSQLPNFSLPVGTSPKQFRSISESFPFTRRRSSSVANELEPSLQRRFSSSRNSISLESPQSLKTDSSLLPSQKRANATKNSDYPTVMSNASTMFTLNKADQDQTQPRDSLTKEPGDVSESLDNISSDLPSNSFDEDGKVRNARAFFKTPLVSGSYHPCMRAVHMYFYLGCYGLC